MRGMCQVTVFVADLMQHKPPTDVSARNSNAVPSHTSYSARCKTAQECYLWVSAGCLPYLLQRA